jgi:hypothetical protein
MLEQQEWFTSTSGDEKQTIIDALEKLNAGGSTVVQE